MDVHGSVAVCAIQVKRFDASTCKACHPLPLPGWILHKIVIALIIHSVPDDFTACRIALCKNGGKFAVIGYLRSMAID
jgi:hypothetical protein